MVKITAINGKASNYLQKEYFLSNVSELKNLPRVGVQGSLNDPDDSTIDEECAYGSTAKVVVNGILRRYILTPDNVWLEYKESSTNSGGGGSGETEDVVDNVVDF